MDMNKEKLIEILESKEVALVFLTATSYLVCYFFQLVYLQWFGVPGEFVDIEINTLILSLGFTALISFGLLFYCSDYVRFEKRNKANKRKLYIARGIVVILLAAFIMFTLNVNVQQALIVVAIAVPATFLGIFSIEAWRRKSFKAAIKFFKEAFKPSSSVPQPEQVEGARQGILPDRLLLYIGVSVLAVFLAVASGRFYAATKHDFMIVHSSGDIKRVVIVKSGTNFVTRDYDTKRHKFEDGYFILRVRDATDKIEDLEIAR